MKKRRYPYLIAAVQAAIILFLYSVPGYCAEGTGLGISPALSDEGLSVIPGVTQDMLRAESWVSGPQYRQILLSPEAIREFNVRNLSEAKTKMTDLLAEPENFDGIALRDAEAGFEPPKGLYLNGEPVLASYYAAIRKNIFNAPAEQAMPVRYGITVNRSVIKGLPYADFLSDAEDDPDWDNLCLSALLVNEPVLVYLTTADGSFCYVKSETISGWMPTADVAICRSRDEWCTAIRHESFLVVTGESVTTEKSRANEAHSEKTFDMGTILELCPEDGSVDNRMSWYSYTVYVPERDENGYYRQGRLLIPMNRDVHMGFLPFTQEALIGQAFKCLGNRYGWGGTLNAQDCSGYVRELYRCFGMKLPLNTTWQSCMPCRVIDVSGVTDQEKLKILSGVSPGAILQFPGHEMLNLGCRNGDCYTINNVSSLCFPSEDGLIRYRLRAVVVNGLVNSWRANGRTWLESLTKIIIPWER